MKKGDEKMNENDVIDEEMNDEELALVLAGHFLESDVKKHSSTQSSIGGSSSWENLTNFRNV